MQKLIGRKLDTVNKKNNITIYINEILIVKKIE